MYLQVVIPELNWRFLISVYAYMEKSKAYACVQSTYQTHYRFQQLQTSLNAQYHYRAAREKITKSTQRSSDNMQKPGTEPIRI